MISFRLPFPPSVNDMYLNNRGKSGRGRIKSPSYRSWSEAAGLSINSQRNGHKLPVPGRVYVEIHLNDKRNGDSDNRIKPVLDTLVASGVLAGDSKKHVKGSAAEWRSDLGAAECCVFISEAPSHD